MFRNPDDNIDPPRGGITLERHVFIGFALAVFMLVGIGAISYSSISDFVVDAGWSRHSYEVLGKIHALRETLQGAENYTRAYVITGDRHYLESGKAAIAAIDSRLLAVKSLTADNVLQQRRIDILRPLIAKKVAVMARQSVFQDNPKLDVESPTVLVADGMRASSEVRGVLSQMEDEENRLLAVRSDAAEISGRRSIRLITFGATSTLILLNVIGWMINRAFAKRRRAETALRASDTLFRALLEAAPDAMVIVTEKGDIEFFNAQAEVMFGYNADELLGKSIEKIIPERYRSECIPDGEGHLADLTEVTVMLDLFGTRKDGAEFPIEISLKPLRTPHGLRVSNAIRDVTIRKAEQESLKSLNASLAAQTAQLEGANRELESFSYSVSHDLRAPLRSIDGFSQALLEDNAGKLDTESEDSLRRVRAASQRMGHLIDDLLNLSRVSRAAMNRETVNISKITREVVEELQAANPNSKAEFVIADELIGEADPRLFRIVMTNLIANAWKFSATRVAPRIEFGAVVTNGDTEYFVRDNGVGFDMNHSGKLFGAFQRLHAANEFPGTGIGLATVQRIVHRHGGRVWADAELQVGAAFHFTLSPHVEDIPLKNAA